ncbi:MAG: hypothetical protein ACR2NR_18015 [Solirubrobacteraceae bacterium]
MPRTFSSRLIPRRLATAVVGGLVALTGLATLPAASLAQSSQIAMIQDGSDLVNPTATFAEFRALGANTVRVIVPWYYIAPKPSSSTKPNFNATDPNAYADSNWAPYDNIVNAAKTYGLKVDFTVTGGAPVWAQGKDIPGGAKHEDVNFAWKPNAAYYGQFMQALATRYDGSFKPKGQTTVLPAVHFWVIYNEPNFGQDLGPQAINQSKTLVGPMMYRGLVDAGFKALQAHHKRDTILIGDFAARGFYLSNGKRPGAPEGFPGNYGQTRPLYFLRYLYCVGSNYKPLTGSAAKSVGCPTTKSATRGFRKAHPGLFNASGVGDHPYPSNGTPTNDGKVTDYATFPELGALANTLDKVNRAYGSGKKYPIYNDEYGYITSPPNGQKVTNQPSPKKASYVSPATAAYYINWADYLSFKSSRIASYMQYLLQDPMGGKGPYSGFASGLEFNNGKHKPGYDAYRLPVYMPQTSLTKSTNAELWGAARPAPFLSRDGAQQIAVQLNGKTIKTVTPGGNGGYFDIKMRFASSGSVRLAYTYPSTDSLLPMSDLGTTVYSRSFNISVH